MSNTSVAIFLFGFLLGLFVGVNVNACELSATDCLARNIYFEARGESTLGKIAVGQVVLNRAKSRRWPSDICSVVYDDWQFSWTEDSNDNIPSNIETFREAWYIASALLDKDSGIIDITQNATHYHSEKITPTWSAKLKYVTQIGEHKFYK